MTGDIRNRLDMCPDERKIIGRRVGDERSTLRRLRDAFDGLRMALKPFRR